MSNKTKKQFEIKLVAGSLLVAFELFDYLSEVV